MPVPKGAKLSLSILFVASFVESQPVRHRGFDKARDKARDKGPFIRTA
jgi:hypothetical protein